MTMRLESFPRICSKDTFNCGFSFQLLKINSQPVQAPTSFVKVIVHYPDHETDCIALVKFQRTGKYA